MNDRTAYVTGPTWRRQDRTKADFARTKNIPLWMISDEDGLICLDAEELKGSIEWTPNSACARAPESCLSSSRSASRPLTWGAHGLDLAVGVCTDRESVMITLHMNPKTLIYWYTERQRIVTSEVKDVEIQGRVPLGATQSLRIESGRVPLWQLVVCENFVDHSFSEAAPAARPADSDEPPLGGDGIFDWTSGGLGPRRGE